MRTIVEAYNVYMPQKIEIEEKEKFNVKINFNITDIFPWIEQDVNKFNH